MLHIFLAIRGLTYCTYGKAWIKIKYEKIRKKSNIGIA